MERPRYDYSELLGDIKRVFGAQSAFAKAMGMAESTLSLKLNNKAEWSQEEMMLAVSLLNAEHSKVGPYFFTRKV